MDGSNPGGGGGGECEMNDDCVCEVCTMWKELDSLKQFRVVVTGEFRDSLRIPQEVGSHLRIMVPLSEPVKLEAPDGRIYPVDVSREVGAAVLRSGWHDFVDAYHVEEDYSILFVYRGNSIFKVHIFDASGQEKSSSCSQPPSEMCGVVPPCAPCDHHVLNEQVVHVETSIDNVYTMLPGCRLTKEQDVKVLEIARTKKSAIPLHVVPMNKRNVNLKNYSVHIPLQLVLNNFKDERPKATIQLEGPDNVIYTVGASKHNGDQVVLDCEWDTFVASHQIQEKDIIIFRRMENSHLEVLILDPRGHEKTSLCLAMGNSSSAQEASEDFVNFVDQKSGCGDRKPLHNRASSNNFGQRPYILGTRTGLPLKVLNQVEEKVQTIGSEHPIYVNLMPRSAVSGGCVMCFSLDYASACLPDETRALFLKVEGKKKVWHATLSVTRQNQRRVGRGWKEFARDNRLKEGDVCLFQLTSRNARSLMMMVHLDLVR